jgi:glutamate carboxypeptidase
MSDAAATLARWCAIPSHAGDPAGARRMAGEVAAALGELGQAALEPVGPGGEPLVRARSAPRPGPRALLVGHYDTVPHDGEGPAPPVVREGDRMVARGAADMKGGLVVMLGALRRLEAGAGAAPAWEALIVPDEELGTPWSRGPLADAARGAAAALVFEPALPDGRIVRARAGVGSLGLRAAGRAAHAGREPHLGRSAVAALAELVGRVEELTDPAAGTVATVTSIAGGLAPNVVPAGATAAVDLRARSAGDADRVVAAIRAAAAEVGARREVAIEIDGGFHRPPMAVGPATERLFAAYREGARRHGAAIDWADVGGGSDANLLAAAGIPVLDGLGAVGGGLHAPDEYALVASLDERAALAAALLARIAGARDGAAVS